MFDKSLQFGAISTHRRFKLHYLLTRRSLGRGDVNDVIHAAEDAREGQYGCIRGLWFHVKAKLDHVSWLLWVWNHEHYQPG